MENQQHYLYYEGYVAGYREGIKASFYNKTAYIDEDDIVKLPIKAMVLSTRAYNCLSKAGCTYIADVAALSACSIAAMRNMGRKTASEVAHWLHTHGICHSAWDQYL